MRLFSATALRQTVRLFRYDHCNLVSASAEKQSLGAFSFSAADSIWLIPFRSDPHERQEPFLPLSVANVLKTFPWFGWSSGEKKQTQQMLRLFEKAGSLVRSGDKIELALEAFQALQGLNASKLKVQQWILKQTPTIARTRSGFFYKFRSSNNGAFTEKKQNILVERVIGACIEKANIDSKTVQVHARHRREEIVRDGNVEHQFRSLKCRFQRDWILFFLTKFNDEHFRKLSRPVDYVSYIAYNANTAEKVLAKFYTLYQQKRITRSAQVCHLDQTGFKPEFDFTGVNRKLVITISNLRALSVRSPLDTWTVHLF